MQGPVKKVILLILLWSGFGFALSEYLEQSPSNQTQKDQTQKDQPLKNGPRLQTNSDGRSDPENLEQIQEQAVERSDNTVQSPVDKPDEPSKRNQDPDNSVTEQPGANSGVGANTIAIVRDTPELVWQEGWHSFSELLIQNAKAYPKLEVTITGYFDPNESIAEPNLGVQRSVRVKNELVKRGVNPDQIKCRGRLNRLFDQSEPKQAVVIQASRPLESFNPPEAPAKISRLKSKPEPRPQSERKASIPKYKAIEYQPTFSDQGIVFEGALTQLLPGAQQWLNLNAQNYIEILGHTDHVGHEQDNYRLALKWARQVRQFMIRQGFDANRLKANSAGEQQPLYTNNNSRGRQKNRRVELILKF